MDLFLEEAIHTHTTIRVHKDIIAWLASKKFPNNIIQMRNEIQISCSKAYMEINDPKKRKELGENGRHKISEVYSKESVLDQWLKIIENNKKNQE